MNRSRTPTILLEPDVRIPAGLSDVEKFRAWVRSDSFPEAGRIDWIDGQVSIDMSPEDLNTHNTVKSAIGRDLSNLVEVELGMGVVCADRMRVSVPEVDLSVEPDVAVLRFESLDQGRVTLVPKTSREAGRLVEIQGPPDIVVECVSDSSVKKDGTRLHDKYCEAGVTEYWFVDARGPEPILVLDRLGSGGS